MTGDMISEADISALVVTLKLAAVTTAILLLVALPLGWWLARTRWRLRPVVESLIALPLVLPPTVLGFYLLILLAPEGPVGRLTTAMGLGSLAFSFGGLVIGSCVYSLPFAVQPVRDAFAAVPTRQLEAAATLRAGPWDAFFSVALPQARAGILTAMVLTFAHTLGEFGVVLMIGGNIPGRTQVLSIAIYDHVEALEYANAHVLAAGLLAFSFLLLLIVHAINGRMRLLRS
jgi:molybdate transport system permease protein